MLTTLYYDNENQQENLPSAQRRLYTLAGFCFYLFYTTYIVEIEHNFNTLFMSLVT